MKFKSTMRVEILILCIGCTIFALLLQTIMFQFSSRQLIQKQSMTENVNALTKMQNELYTYIRSMESNMISTYNETGMIQTMHYNQNIFSLRKSYYWKAYDLEADNFEASDGVASLYLYDSNSELISVYRHDVQYYPWDIYSAEYDTNADRVLNYINSDNTEMLVSSYFNPNQNAYVIRFVLRLYPSSNSHEVVGYLVCDVNSSNLIENMNKYISSSEMLVWLQPDGDRAMAAIGTLSDKYESYYEGIIKQIEVGGSGDSLQEEYGKCSLFKVKQENIIYAHMLWFRNHF